MEKINVQCCVCGSSLGDVIARGWDFEYATTKEEYTFKRCVTCGHHYLDPRPSNKDLNRIYPSDYYSYDLNQRVNPLALLVKKTLKKRKIKALLAYVQNDNPCCLDIGCGDGRILNIFEECGVSKDNLYGVEVDNAAVKSINKMGYHGEFGDIEHVHYADELFDCIVMFQVLEHVDDPARVFQKVLRLLKPGGIFIIETPNIQSLDARIFRKRYWGGYHFPRHWNLFDKKSLLALASRQGFKAIKLETFICAVFWIYPFHHYLRECKFPPWVYRFFWPLNNPLLLALATSIDVFLAPLGLAGNLRGVFKKEL